MFIRIKQGTDPSGLGYGVAEALLENGSQVIISSSNQSRVEKAISGLQKAYPSASSNITGYAYDMATESTLESNIVALLDRTGGKLDHIVWTAGDALATVAIADITFEQVKKAGMVRYFGPVMLGKHAPKYLNPGPEASITLTTGSVSQKPLPNWAAVAGYATGLHGLTRGLALDLKPIRVNLISPGGVATDLWAGLPADVREERFKQFANRSLTGKIGDVVDVTESYLYVMKDRNVTGTVISTNSGALLL